MRGRPRRGCLVLALPLALLALVCALWWGFGARRVAAPAAGGGEEGEEAGIVQPDGTGESGGWAGAGEQPAAAQHQTAFAESDGESDFLRYETTLALPACAESLLEAHSDGEASVLVHAGYLDLLCRVWGCLVQGDGWVEVDVVQETEKGSEVTVIRMYVQAWGDSYGQ